jgi:hypothetical protein
MNGQNKKPSFDIVNEVLEECIMAYPVSSFVISLYKQYRERGSLSKKQLQGLLGKASDIEDINPAKVATLEALINKMPTREKAAASAPTPLYEKDEVAGKMIADILAKFPEHKRILFLQSKYDNNEPLSSSEMSDLKRVALLASKK